MEFLHAQVLKIINHFLFWHIKIVLRSGVILDIGTCETFSYSWNTSDGCYTKICKEGRCHTGSTPVKSVRLDQIDAIIQKRIFRLF